MSLVAESEWKQFIINSEAHLLQSAEWGELKANFNWGVHRLIVGNAGAQILTRQILPGIKFAYIPKGPVGIRWVDSISEISSWKRLFDEIDNVCRRERVFLLKIEPDVYERINADHVETDSGPRTPEGFHESTHTIQPKQTIVVNLEKNEDRILGRMKQKTRYNINLARRKNIVVHPSSDVSLFFQMMKETGDRDNFLVHDESYYQKAYEIFYPHGSCELLMADFEGTPIAGLMVFASGYRSWYLYGASTNLHRERMSNYFLQWEAMLWAKAQGCREYDLWGIPDDDLETLEGQFTQRSDGLWGVYRFKRGFGGNLRRSTGPWDRIYNRLLYNLYRWWINRKGNLE